MPRVLVSPEELPERDLEEYLSDPEDLSDEALLTRFQQIEPLLTVDKRVSNVVFLIGLPAVESEKYDKLTMFLKLQLNKNLQLEKQGDEDAANSGEPYQLDHPRDKSGASLGYAMLTMRNQFEAQAAVRSLSGLAFGAKHQLRVCMLDEFDEIVAERPEVYQTPEVPPLPEVYTGHTWMMDPSAREQFLLRHSVFAGPNTEPIHKSEIYWNDPILKDPQLVTDFRQQLERRDKNRPATVLTQFDAHWSPYGTYLATFHRKGVSLWSCAVLTQVRRLEHWDAKRLLMSSEESYALTWDGTPADAENPKAICCWDVKTGEMLRSWNTPKRSPQGSSVWPFLTWSYDGTFLARVGETQLFVYAAPSMQLISQSGSAQGAPLKLGENFSAAWSPTANTIAVWVPPKNDKRGGVQFVEIPSRRVVASKVLFDSVDEVQILWQDKGEYMALVAQRYQKVSKKKLYAQIEIFRVSEKGVPIDSIKLDENTRVKQVAWERGGNRRLAVVLDKEVQFYEVEVVGEQRETRLVCTHSFAASLGTATLNHLQWSPMGSYFALGSIGPTGDGTIFFCSLTEENKVDTTHKDTHWAMNNISWDPSGRHVATCVITPLDRTSSRDWNAASECGYRLYTFQGRLIYQANLHSLYRFAWRPRQPSLLKPEEVEKIKQDIKDYTRRYDAADEEKRHAKYTILQEEREKMEADFEKLTEACEKFATAQPMNEEWEKAWETYNSSITWKKTVEYEFEEMSVERIPIGAKK